MKNYGYVYVIQCGPHYKIGYSKNPDARMKQLGTQPPFELEMKYILATGGDARAFESRLHEIFSERRVRGEWFELNETDLDLLEQFHRWLGMFHYSCFYLLSWDIVPRIIPLEERGP